MLDPAVEHLWGFIDALRRAGSPCAPPNQADFFQALAGTPPRDIVALYWRARVTLMKDITHLAVFDEVFDAWFRRGQATEAVSPPAEEDSETQSPRTDGDNELPAQEAKQGDGVEAAADAVTDRRILTSTEDSQRRLMRELVGAWPECLPAIRSRRWRPSRSGPRLDMRAVWRSARRTGGEIVQLRHSARPPRTRRLLLLVDVSGSLKQHTPDLLRVAYTAVRALGQAEVFTFGTRLTRVTSALSHRHVDQSLRALTSRVHDVDGGTAIGAAFEEFLANTRFVALARGAVVIVISDGLERGDCRAMVRASDRLGRLGHRLLWWSPLACAPTYRPVTRGMAQQLPLLDHLGGVRDLATALAELRRVPAVAAGPRRTAARRWTTRL
jgi:uncharacterized protein with von Willebrand factor type A (vWA) domain